MLGDEGAAEVFRQALSDSLGFRAFGEHEEGPAGNSKWGAGNLQTGCSSLYLILQTVPF